jgi:hypothetical protein
MTLSRPRSPHDCELNHVLPQTRRLPASTLPCVRRAFLQTTQRSGFCAALGVGNRFHTALIAGGSVRFSPDLPRISLRRNDPWQDATQDCAESLGFAASIIGSRHAQQHGEVDDQEGVPAFQGCGNAN